MLFDFMNDMGNYKERVVDHYEQDNLTIDTCFISDSSKDYETGIQHPKYNNGKWVIVELYDTRDEAVAGHKKWVLRMTTHALPEYLTDVSDCDIAELCSIAGGESWRKIKKEE